MFISVSLWQSFWHFHFHNLHSNWCLTKLFVIWNSIGSFCDILKVSLALEASFWWNPCFCTRTSADGSKARWNVDDKQRSAQRAKVPLSGPLCVCVRSLCKATLRPAGLTDGLHRSCAKCTSSIVRCASLCQVSPTWRLVPLYTATMWHLSIFMLEDLPTRLTMIVTNIKENTWFVGVQFPLIYVSLKWLGDLFGNNQMQIYAPCAPCHGSFGNICGLRSSSLKRMSALENQMTHSSSFCSNLNDCVWKRAGPNGIGQIMFRKLSLVDEMSQIE